LTGGVLAKKSEIFSINKCRFLSDANKILVYEINKSLNPFSLKWEFLLLNDFYFTFYS